MTPSEHDPLAALVGPERRHAFEGPAWPEQALSTRGAPARLRLPAALWTTEPAEWIDTFVGHRRAGFVGAAGIERMLEVPDAALARLLYERGHTVMLAHFHRAPAFPRPWAAALAAALGIADRDPPVAATLFVSPAGSGLSEHCDRAAFFVLQLFGRKRWQVGPNPVRYPSRGWGPRRGTPMPTHFERAGVRPEACMPPDAQDFELTAGDALYVPAGAWHRTAAGSDSVSLTLIPAVTRWHDLVGRALLRTLAACPGALGPAEGLGAAQQQRRRAEARLLDLLAQLLRSSAELTPEALRAQLERDGSR